MGLNILLLLKLLLVAGLYLAICRLCPIPLLSWLLDFFYSWSLRGILRFMILLALILFIFGLSSATRLEGLVLTKPCGGLGETGQVSPMGLLMEIYFENGRSASGEDLAVWLPVARLVGSRFSIFVIFSVWNGSVCDFGLRCFPSREEYFAWLCSSRHS